MTSLLGLKPFRGFCNQGWFSQEKNKNQDILEGAGASLVMMSFHAMTSHFDVMS